MADIHPLPLLGHDLPESAAPPAPEKVKVYRSIFKAAPPWRWKHVCEGGPRIAFGGVFETWEAAMEAADKHARRCR